MIFDLDTLVKKWIAAICISIMAAALFAILSSYRLTAQGLYYDELHQAAGSFSYTKKFVYDETAPYMFSRARVGGIPVLNMSYSGAIKTGIYGLYLRYVNGNFDVFVWRLLGIISVGCGIFIFFLILARKLSPISLILFLLLFVTDVSVVLATRHDWGPVALAMFIRLLFIAIWIQGETEETPKISNSFFLGFLVGVAVFEKLSSVVLILPLVLIFGLSPRRKTKQHRTACAAGGILGGVPLITLNFFSLLKQGSLISLQAVSKKTPYSFSGFVNHVSDYISLGAGSIVKSFIFDIDSTHYGFVEGLLLTVVIFCIAFIILRYYKTDRYFSLSGIMLISYIAVGISLYLLPKRSWMIHWVIGTPFQYAAILLAVQGVCSQKKQPGLHWNIPRYFLLCIVTIMIISRLIGLTSVAKAVERGDASIHWDHSLSEIGYFASRHSNEALFIAADWGLATQIFCLSNGKPDLVHELFWKYQGPEEIKKIVEDSGKNIVYVVSINPKTNVRPKNTERILRDIEKMKFWNEVPLEKVMANLRAVKIKKYSRVIAK